jgi:hypothetical protein
MMPSAPLRIPLMTLMRDMTTQVVTNDRTEKEGVRLVELRTNEQIWQVIYETSGHPQSSYKSSGRSAGVSSRARSFSQGG